MYSGSDTNISWGHDLLHKPGGNLNKRRFCLVVFLALAVGLGVGLLIGALAIGDGDGDGDGLRIPGAPARLMMDGDEDIWPHIRDGISAKNIEDNLRVLSSKPHIAGRKNDFKLVELIKERWQKAGLEVQTTPYDILLAYPSDDTPNTVRLLDGSGDVTYDSTWDQSNITNNPDVVAPFLAYSPSKLIVGQPVFAGYGRVEDYDWLLSQGINVSGHIAIVKYGKLFRGDKIDIAHSKGAIGVVLYSDPNDYTGILMNDTRVYPDTWWLPPSGVQRGTVFTGSGDPLTPGFAANDLAYRYTPDTVDPPMPQIPCQAIGYGAAIHFLQHMTGPAAPTNKFWQGGLNITYRLGPGFVDSTWKIQLNVTNQNKRAKADNVFGIIKGSIEPDRYVMMGNHRDAWIYGALDPSSGTAVMLEVARVMAGLVKQGKWQPRRSIMFCSWGAEEYGLIGSTEWVEQYVSTLRERVVAYVNVDTAVSGNDTLSAAGTPVLHSLLFDAAKKASNPNAEEVKAGRTSVYDTWLRMKPWKDDKGHVRDTPIVGKPASGSDHAPLLQMAGIDAVSVGYRMDGNKYKVSGYALYHSEYETFEVVKDQFDRDFKYHQAVATVAAEMVRSLADSLLVPFNLTTYAEHMELYRQILDHGSGAQLKSHLDNYDALENVIANFSQDISDFESRVAAMDVTKNPYITRQVNDQIMLLEKAFLTPQGLPTRPLKKHLIFAENANDAYAGSSFPGIVDLLFEIDKHPDRWEEVKKQFSILLQAIQAAGASLRDVTRFMTEHL